LADISSWRIASCWCDAAPHRFDRAWKFRQDGVTGGVENPSAGFGDEVVGDGPVGGQTPQRLLFVLGDQPRIAGNIRRKISRRNRVPARAAPGKTANSSGCLQRRAATPA
jgi:hypothetical protein